MSWQDRPITVVHGNESIIIIIKTCSSTIYVLWTLCPISINRVHCAITMFKLLSYRGLGFRWFMVCILFLKVLRVFDSTTSLGSLFHVLMVWGKKEFKW